MTNKRPLVVTIVGLLNLASAIMMIVASGLLAFVATLPFTPTEPQVIEWGTLMGILMIVTIATGCLGIVISIGIFKGWKWCWYLAIISWIIGIVSGLASLNVIAVALDAIFLFFFFKKNVKDYFDI